METTNYFRKKCKIEEATEQLPSYVDALQQSSKFKIIDPIENNPFLWKVTEVSNFIGGLPGCKKYVETFKFHEIDGYALMLLKKHHLISNLEIKPNSAVEIINALEAMRDEIKRKTNINYYEALSAGDAKLVFQNRRNSAQSRS